MKKTFNKVDMLFQTIPIKKAGISCQQAVEILGMIRKKENVSASDRFAVMEHLRTCTVCGEEISQEAEQASFFLT